MKKRVSRTPQPLLRFVPAVLLALALLSLVAALLLLWHVKDGDALARRNEYRLTLLAALLALAAVIWWQRVIHRFRRRLMRLLDDLYEGRYNVVLRRAPDEFADLATRFNEVLGRLREFDELRARRVARANRALDILFEAFPAPAAFLDTSEEVFRINAAFRALYQTSNERFTWEALSALEKNRALVDLCAHLLLGEAQRAPVVLDVALPPDGRTRRLEITPYPFREPPPGGPAALLVARPVAD